MKKCRGKNELGDDHDAVVGEESDSQSPPMKKSRGNNEVGYHHNAEWNVVGLETDSPPPLMENSQGNNELGDDRDAGRNVVLEDSDVGLAETEMRRVITDGFNVEIVPPELSGCFLTFKDLDSIYSADYYTVHNAYYCVKFAVNFYNEHKKSKLYFVSFLKFNFDKIMEPNMYYLTFNAADGPKSVCQAKVAFSEFKGDRKAEVLLFRRKSRTYEQSKGVEQEQGTDSMVKENPFPPSDALWEEELVVSLALENPQGNSERGDDHDSERSKDEEGDDHHDSERSKDEEGDDTFSKHLEVERRKQWGSYVFKQQRRKSQGFKVPPRGYRCGSSVLIVKDLASIKKLDKYLYHTAYYCAKSAVNYYNEHHEKSKLEFVELVKLNLDNLYNRGPKAYYITFEARDGGDGRVSFYHAKVMYTEGCGGGRNAKLVLFRKIPVKQRPGPPLCGCLNDNLHSHAEPATRTLVMLKGRGALIHSTTISVGFSGGTFLPQLPPPIPPPLSRW